MCKGRKVMGKEGNKCVEEVSVWGSECVGK